MRAPRQTPWLDRFLAVRLAGAGGAARRELDQACRAAGRPLRELLVLALVHDQRELRLGTVADRLGLQRSEISRLVPELHDEGWLLWEPNPLDARSSVVRMAPGGAGVLAAAEPVLDRVDRALRSHLTPLRQRQLLACLELLRGPATPVEDALRGSGL